MANDFIKINLADTSATLARDTKNAIEAIRSAITQVDKVVGILQHNFDAGDNIDWTHVEAICGVPAGKGQILFTLLDGARGVLTGEFQNANAVELINRIG